MEEKFKTYSEYKDSGVEGVGEIPKHWALRRLASFGNFSKCGGFSKSDLKQSGVRAFLYGDIYTQYNIKSHSPVRFIDNQTAERSVIIQTGDLLFSGSGEDIAEIGKCVTYTGTENVVGGGDIIKFRPKKGNSVFLSYALNSDGANFEKSRSSKGEIIVHTYASKLRTIRTPFPPHDEQIAIANFLDDKVSKIDEAIAQKEQLIQLLNERKQIIIQNAVTKGLNPNAPMKDSGIEWIGKIPEHWEVEYNKNLFVERNQNGEEGLPLLSVSIHSGVSSDELNEDENIRGKVKIQDKSNYKLVESGDVAYNMMRAWQGGIGGVKNRGMVSPAYVVAKPKETLNSAYFELQYRLPLFIQEMSKVSKGITDFRKRLYWTEFRNLQTIVPPASEQLKIVERVEQLSNKVYQAVVQANEAIDKLKEYKATLINSAVTGKINIMVSD